MADWGQEKTEWLHTLLELRASVPAHDTFSRFFRILDAAALEAMLLVWVLARRPELATGAQELALVRSDVLSWLRRDRSAKLGMKDKRFKAGWNGQNVVHILTQ